MDESVRNLLEGLGMVQWPDPPRISHKLYYADDGCPICYSMEDLPGNYIEVDPETFWTGPRNIRVVNGAIKYIIVNNDQKLSPNGQGTPCHPNNVSIVVTDDRPNMRWSIKRNETY